MVLLWSEVIAPCVRPGLVPPQSARGRRPGNTPLSPFWYTRSYTLAYLSAAAAAAAAPDFVPEAAAAVARRRLPSRSRRPDTLTSLRRRRRRSGLLLLPPLWPGFSTWSPCLLVATYTKGDEGRRRGRSAHSAVTTKGRRRRQRRPCGNSVSRFLRLSKMPIQQRFQNPSPLMMISLRTTDHIFDRPNRKPHLCQ